MTSFASSFVRPRKVFEKLAPTIEIPYLIELQRSSYHNFLQADVSPDERKNTGLQAVFRSVFPIIDFSETASVEFVSYSFEEPKYSVDECRQRGMSFAAPLKVVIRLVVWDVEKESGVKSIRDVKEQEVYFGEIPLMTENGTFIINGTERVVVSQLHRSSGVFFDHDKGKNSASGKLLYTARVIPYRGSWLDFEFDAKDLLHVRIDRRRKMHATILLKALGYTENELLDRFYKKEMIRIRDGKFEKRLNYDLLRGQRSSVDMVDPSTGKVLVKKGRRISVGAIRQLEKAEIEYIPMEKEELIGKVTAQEVKDKKDEVVVELNIELNEELIDEILNKGVEDFSVLFIDRVNADSSFRDTLLADKITDRDEAMLEIYKRMRPGDPPALEPAAALFENLFFNPDRYDLSAVGRMKLNEKLGVDIPIETRTLVKEDILKTVEYLLGLKNDRGQIDDIDNLGNRRVRAVGELLKTNIELVC